jgi:DNA-binding transcriptional LysR family regulator
MIELRHLRHLLALAHHGNFSRAADELGLTQPALSRSIQSLEALVGASLFERNRAGIEPTDLGRLLLRHAQAVDASARDMDRDLQLAQGLQLGELRIGVGPWGATTLCGPAIVELNRLHPRLRIEVVNTPWIDMPERLRRREVDLVVAGSRHFAGQPDVTAEPLSEHPVHLVCRAGHPLTRRTPFVPGHLFDYPLAGPPLPPAAAAQLIQWGPPEWQAVQATRADPGSPMTIDCQDAALLMNILLHSDAVAGMPDFMTAAERADGRLVKIPDFSIGFTTGFAAVWLKQRALSAAGRKFVDLLVEHDRALASNRADNARDMPASTTSEAVSLQGNAGD